MAFHYGEKKKKEDDEKEEEIARRGVNDYQLGFLECACDV